MTRLEVAVLIFFGLGAVLAGAFLLLRAEYRPYLLIGCGASALVIAIFVDIREGG